MGAFEGLFISSMAFIGIIALLLTGLWIWMLIDCAVNEPNTGNDKLIWIIIIVLVGWLGALIYLLARRPRRIQEYGK